MVFCTNPGHLQVLNHAVTKDSDIREEGRDD
jgi:hypothetical protein